MADELTIHRGPWQKFSNYCREVKIEMKRVNWPGKREVYGNTVMVLACTFAFAAFFYLCDQSFSTMIRKLLAFLTHRTA
ncbi:MAG: preprotein translocase subunit SecE [Terriglobia bacterium]